MELSTLKNNIKTLPLKARADLAKWIITHLDEEGISQEEIDAAWRKEIRKRINDIKSGKVKMISTDDMWKEILSAHEAKAG
ncbi:MAG: addiction module protein [Proteobacteria bacterium]|nr:addiction module protein [Pseudomonadota bacterium]